MVGGSAEALQLHIMDITPSFQFDIIHILVKKVVFRIFQNIILPLLLTSSKGIRQPQIFDTSLIGGYLKV